MTVSGWRVNWDALLARIVYRWSGRTLLVMLAICAGLALFSGVVPPVWRGEAQLRLAGPPGAKLEVDGKPWPHTLYAGTHIATATLPDGRSSSVELRLARDEQAEATLPPGLGRPRVRMLPPDGPQSTVVRASFAHGAWRLQSRAAGDAQAGLRTVTLSAARLEPLSLLDAYAGLADIVTTGSRTFRALHVPDEDRSGGTLEVHGWDGGARTFPITGTLSFVGFGPGARALLISERLRSDGEELRLISPAAEPIMVLAVPGRVNDVVWHPAGHAAALLSHHRDRLTLTVVRFKPTLATRLLAELVVPQASPATNDDPALDRLPIVPLTWSGSSIEWLAPDEHGSSSLWRASLATLLPERSGPLDAAAVYRTPAGALRIVRYWRGGLAIGRHEAGRFVVEAWIDDIPPASRLAGIWAPDGSSLLLRSGSSAWLVDLPKQEL